MRVAVKNHALPVYKKIRIASLLCIFEGTIHIRITQQAKTKRRSISGYRRFTPLVVFLKESLKGFIRKKCQRMAKKY